MPPSVAHPQLEKKSALRAMQIDVESQQRLRDFADAARAAHEKSASKAANAGTNGHPEHVRLGSLFLHEGRVC